MVRPDGSVSNILYDRLIIALNLFDAGKAPKILLSGDHGRIAYDEVNAMQRFLEDRGVDGKKFFLDHAGFSTYESVYRSKAVFQVKKVIIVTQEYHLTRAIFNARQLGLDAYGVTSDLNEYRGMAKFALREIVARNKDFLYLLSCLNLNLLISDLRFLFSVMVRFRMIRLLIVIENNFKGRAFKIVRSKWKFSL